MNVLALSSFHHHILQIKLLDFNLFLKSSFESKVLFSTCLYKEDFLTAFWPIHVVFNRVEMAFSLQSHHACHDWCSWEDLWTFKGRSWVAKRSPWSPLWTQQIFHSSSMEWLLLVDPLPYPVHTATPLPLFVTLNHFNKHTYQVKSFGLVYQIILGFVCDILVVFNGVW